VLSYTVDPSTTYFNPVYKTILGAATT